MVSFRNKIQGKIHKKFNWKKALITDVKCFTFMIRKLLVFAHLHAKLLSNYEQLYETFLKYLTEKTCIVIFIYMGKMNIFHSSDIL